MRGAPVMSEQRLRSCSSVSFRDYEMNEDRRLHSFLLLCKLA
jgi:hypothetical protein